MGRKIKIFFGIILLLVGFAFLGNAVVTGEPYGATFGAFILIAGIYLLFSSSEPKIPKMKPSDLRCSNCGYPINHKLTFCPSCEKKLKRTNEIKGIKVIEKDNKIIAKGIPKISKGAILTGILILILCLFVSGSPKPFNVLVIAIFAMMIMIGGTIHAIKERKKAIREYNKREIQ